MAECLPGGYKALGSKMVSTGQGWGMDKVPKAIEKTLCVLLISSSLIFLSAFPAREGMPLLQHLP